jgi:D,D-heptose 1,7-bisphosphate phosphatase
MILRSTISSGSRSIRNIRALRCAFLDRDGVLNRDAGYTYRTEDLIWIDGAIDAVRRLNEAGYLVIVVTNQSGIGRGIYTETEMRGFHSEMNMQLSAHGAHIDEFYHCPFHSEASINRYKIANHPDRKPNPGLILRAAEDWDIDLGRSFLVGDKTSDLAAAAAAGIDGFIYTGQNLDDLVQSILLSAR